MWLLGKSLSEACMEPCMESHLTNKGTPTYSDQWIIRSINFLIS